MSLIPAQALARVSRLIFALLDDAKRNVKIISVVLGLVVIMKLMIVSVIHCSSETQITCACLVSFSNMFYFII